MSTLAVLDAPRSATAAIAPAGVSLLASPPLVPPSVVPAAASRRNPRELSPEEHAECTRLMLSCERLAACLARHIHGGASWLDVEEMIAETQLPLWKAAIAFDPLRGLKFSTLAQTYVERHLWRYVEREARYRRIRCVRLARQERRGDSDDATDMTDVLPDPHAEDSIVQLERRDELRGVFRRLKKSGTTLKMRRFVWDRFARGLSLTELAEVYVDGKSKAMETVRQMEEEVVAAMTGTRRGGDKGRGLFDASGD